LDFILLAIGSYRGIMNKEIMRFTFRRKKKRQGESKEVR
jgi:hypothetical protein